jgi:hypothetical protein
VAESNGQDVHWPWFSGLRLGGEVAGQYQIQSSDTEQELKDSTRAAMLELDALAPITIFVGANNSGKSRLMRELFGNSLPKFKLKCRNSEGTEVDIGRMLPAWTEVYGIVKFDNAIYSTESWIGEFLTSKISEWLKEQNAKIALNGSEDLEGKTKYLALKQLASGYGIKAVFRANNAKRCYVPILRGMRPPFTQHQKGEDHERYKDLYKKRSLSDYFKKANRLFMGSGERNLIFTGLSLYDDLLGRLLGRTQAERNSVRVYENFFSENFFPGQSVILIPVMEGDNDVVHIKIGDNEERPIYDLGDGMQSLIICTYPIVTETEPGSLFFLEEPDLCMHPSLQRTFLEVLKTYHCKMGHQFFITTHSNHLLDLLEDNELVSIFSFSEIADRAPAPTDPSQADSGSNSQSFKPKPSFRIRPSNLRDRQILLELGVRPSATYLANATVWVEGVSDCAYLRAYMEAFVHYLKIRGNDWGKNSINDKSLAQRLEEYKEDRHYAFVEYSGSNLEHYSFTDKGEDGEQAEVKANVVTSVPDLCARAIVIADGDIGDNGKGDRKESFAAQLGDRFIWLPGKEIENMIPEALMREQVRRDNSKIETISPGLVDEIRYEKYYRAGNGVGAYLYDLGFAKPKYKEDGSSGTLSSHMKGKWANNDRGIPWLVRQELRRDNKAAEDGCVSEDPPNAGNSQSNDEARIVKALPSYLTQDLIWLCVCLYVHIANCNHDQETEQKLKKFQQFIRGQGKDFKGPTVDANDGMPLCVESDKPAESAAPEWPIKAVERHCLLTVFLDSTSKPKAIPSPHPKPQAQVTSTATGYTAYPASLTP